MQTSRKLRGLFINPTKANCSIYESGCMVYNCLLLSDMYDLDYKEVNENNRSLPDNYDFYAFNYHHITMGWLDTRFVRKLPGLKLTFVLEVSPNNPFVLCPSEDFDAYCVLDPTMDISDKRVYPFPRPLEVPKKLTPYREQSVPIIGSFGFATPGKGFELVVDAVNKEFDEAIVRINIPPGTYADDSFWYLHKQNYADYLTHLCKNTAKKGIQLIATHNYMSKEELIEWCSQNTLNCFLYNRNQTGLSATTDQAISSGRPLAISDNETFRHITKYIKPYPYRNLKESIISSQPEVMRIQKEWSPENFAKKFEEFLQDFNLMGKNVEDKKTEKIIELKIKQSPILISYAQNFEDVILWRALKHIEKGFYVDIGAAWAEEHSVTKAFYDAGWSGINVEPNQYYIKELERLRSRDINLQLAVSDSPGNRILYFIQNTGLSSLDESVAKTHENLGYHSEASQVNVKTLFQVFFEYASDKPIHFLKIDVEGLEKKVLLGNDWNHFRPWIVVVEATKPMSQEENHEDWEYILLDANYEFIYADGLNRFYLSKEQINLKEKFKYPPNAFDNFVLYNQIHAEKREAEAKEAMLSAQQELESLLRSLSWRITKPLRQLATFKKSLHAFLVLALGTRSRVVIQRALLKTKRLLHFVIQ